jgi:hypothetical protein
MIIPPGLLTAGIGFLRKYWTHLLVAAAVGAYTIGVYWAGGRPARAELEEERAEWREMRTKMEAQFRLREASSRALIAKLEGERDDRIERINKTWARMVGEQEDAAARAVADLERLREQPRGGGAAQPVRVVAEVCDDAAANRGLSDAISRHLAEVRRVLAGERAAVAGLLKACELQTGDLLDVQTWAAGERTIHREGVPLPDD